MYTCSNKKHFEKKITTQKTTQAGQNHWAYPFLSLLSLFIFLFFFNSTWVKGYCAKPLHGLAPGIRFLWHCPSVMENFESLYINKMFMSC